MVPPIKQPAPLPPQYPGVSYIDRTIEKIGVGEPLFVTLDDRSLWKIRSADERVVHGWTVGDTITVSTFGYSRSPNYPYVLDDRTTATWADARYVPRY